MVLERVGVLKHTRYGCWRWAAAACVTLLVVAAARPAIGQSSGAGQLPGAPPAAQPAQSQPTTAPADKEREKQALIEAIKARVAERQKSQPPPAPTSQPLPSTGQPPTPAVNPPPRPPGAAQVQPKLPGATQPASQPTTQGAGCHGPEMPALVPPPPDAPQPKFVCKEQSVMAEPVWSGQQALCVFMITNEGQGALQIQLKGG